uniref:Putative impact n=1 Tax=Ixodes ricinus TaxID=34613 RepID=A0A0K8REX0_IXORI
MPYIVFLDLVLHVWLWSFQFGCTFSYRILQTEPRSVLLKDSADDGETYAGTRLLHLLDASISVNLCDWEKRTLADST